jgi:hypothetical protein
MTRPFKPVDSCACCTGMPTEFHESLAEIAFKASICGLANKGCLVEEMEDAMHHRVDRLSLNILSVADQPPVGEVTWQRLCEAHELVLRREVPMKEAGAATMTVAEGFSVLYGVLRDMGGPNGAVPYALKIVGGGQASLSTGCERAAAYFLYRAAKLVGRAGCSSEELLRWLVVYSCANQYSPTGTPPVLYAVRHVRPSTLAILLDRFEGNPLLHSAGLGDTALHRVASEGYDSTAEALLSAVLECCKWWEAASVSSTPPIDEKGGCGHRILLGFLDSPNAQGRTALVHLRATMAQREITPDISRYQSYMGLEKTITDAKSHPLR